MSLNSWVFTEAMAELGSFEHIAVTSVVAWVYAENLCASVLRGVRRPRSTDYCRDVVAICIDSTTTNKPRSEYTTNPVDLGNHNERNILNRHT